MPVTTTPQRTAGLAAARAAYNASLPPASTALTDAEYWAFVYSHYAGAETEQELYDRATDSYCEQFGLPLGT